MVLQQAVVNLIDVGKIVDRMASGVLVVHTHVVVENSMEANILKSCGFPDGVQVASIALTQGENRSSGSEHLFPEMREWCERGRRIELNHLSCGGGRNLGRARHS